MKSFLLAALATCITGSLIAQSNASSFEVALHGGLCTNTVPHGVSPSYQGQRTDWNFAPAVSFHYNIDEHWQAGVNIGMTKWETKGDWQLTGANNLNLGTKEVTYVLADPAVSVALQANYMIPFYDKYGDFNRANFYVGISVGGVVTGNDGRIIYDKVNPRTPVEYTYTSEYHYESGYGYLAGLQIGYTYFVSQHVGLNLEFAPKFASVYTVDPRYAGSNQNFNLFYFPASLGITYRFGYQ